MSELNTDKFPVRYFYFFLVLDHLRSTGQLLADTDALLRQCQDNQCAIKDQDDLDAMLLLFQRLGEILYFPEDNLLQSVVVLSPHVVLGILSRLMDVPKMADRAREFVDEWERLASTGVCSRALFEHVLSLHARELHTQSDTVIYLLQTLNLICPLNVGGGVGGRGRAGDGIDVSGLRYRARQRAESYGGEGGREGGSGGGGGSDGGGNVSVSGLRYRGRQAAEGADDEGSGGGGHGEGSVGNGGEGTGGGGGGDGGDDDDDDDNDDGSDEDNTRADRNTPPQREPTEHDETQGAEQFLVPAALPRDLPQDHLTWDTHPGDWPLRVDGLPVLPHPAFLRLLSVCAAQDACETQDDLGRPVLAASQSRASFTFGRSRCYKLEWMTTSEVAHIYHGRLLKVVVAGGDVDDSFGREFLGGGAGLEGSLRRNVGSGDSLGLNGGSREASPQAVVEFVWRSLSEIVRRDFRRCHLRLGVACPCSAPHYIPCEEVS